MSHETAGGLPRISELDQFERANVLTHGFGVLLSLLGGGWLVWRFSIATFPTLLVVALVLYVISLVGVFFCSMMSHWYLPNTAWREKYRALDQAFIYLLIVASYTPLSVAKLTATWWWILLAIMWTIAFVGFASKAFFNHRVNSISVWGYLILGWLPAVFGMPWEESLPAGSIWGIVGGGVVYSLGVIFLLIDNKVWYFHAIWHLFVVAGATVHFATLAIYVL